VREQHWSVEECTINACFTYGTLKRGSLNQWLGSLYRIFYESLFDCVVNPLDPCNVTNSSGTASKEAFREKMATDRQQTTHESTRSCLLHFACRDCGTASSDKWKNRNIESSKALYVNLTRLFITSSQNRTRWRVVRSCQWQSCTVAVVLVERLRLRTRLPLFIYAHIPSVKVVPSGQMHVSVPQVASGGQHSRRSKPYQSGVESLPQFL